MRKWGLVIALCALFAGLSLWPRPTPETATIQKLKTLGLAPVGALQKETVTLPAESDAAWRAYLRMQEEAGYSMEAYAGETVTKITCVVSGYPAAGTVYAHVYFRAGRIIGGDIMTTALDGFMHGLCLPGAEEDL